jgi:hypothetical protein
VDGVATHLYVLLFFVLCFVPESRLCIAKLPLAVFVPWCVSEYSPIGLTLERGEFYSYRHLGASLPESAGL